MSYIKQLGFFVLLLVSLSVGLMLQNMLHLSPQSAHQWRQGDCASQVSRYYQDGMNFFSPAVHNLIDYKETPNITRGNTVGEFPILYYIAAAIDKMIGEEYVFVPRGLNFLIFALGLWALYRLFWHVSGNVLVSLCAAFSFLTSPVLFFYGVNFLPNVPVLGLTFVSWLWLFQYQKTRKIHWFWAFQLLSAMIGLIRPTFLVTWSAVGVVWLIDAFRSDKNILLFDSRQRWQSFISFFVVIIPSIAWRLFSTYYNDLHHSTGFFLANVMPIWATNLGQRTYMWDKIVNFWLPHYWWNVSGVVTILLAMWCLFRFRVQNLLFRNLLWLIFLGELMYFVLFFKQFSVHDYYSIDLFVFPAIVLLNFLFYLKNSTNALSKTWVQAIFVIFLLGNVIHTHKMLWQVRYNPAAELMQNLPQPLDIPRVRHFLRQNNILPTDTVISLSDYSPNASLYMLNVRGFTNWNFGSVYPDSALIVPFAKTNNVKYLIVNSFRHNMLDSLREHLPPVFARMDSTLLVYRFSDYKK
jgi:hypothetical protein